MKYISKLLSAITILALLGTMTASAGIVNSDVSLTNDGNMEKAGTASWAASNATLTKEVGSATGQGSSIMRVTRTGALGGAYQGGLTVGKIYRVRGYFRGDGTNAAIVYTGTNSCAYGLTSTSWQYFDCVQQQSGVTTMSLTSASTNGKYVDFDDVSVTQVAVWDFKKHIQNRDIQILADGNQEKAGTASYGNLNSPTLSKELGSVDGQGLQVLRVAYNATPVYYATTTGLSAVSYRLRGWMRSSGAGVSPRVAFGGGTDFIGSASTTWQYFDITGIPTNGIVYYGTSNSSGYTEFDNVSLNRVYGTIQDRDATLLSNGNYENGTTGWTNVDGTLTAETGASNTTGTGIARLAYNATTNPYFYQNITSVVGGTYRIRGWARGDGVKTPRVQYASTVLWTGSASTTWQPFDVSFTSVGASSQITLRVVTAVAGYADFDNITVNRVF